MRISSELGQRLCGVMSACWSDSYPNALEFAKALERIAAEARRVHAHQQAAEGGTPLIG